jgi:glutaredoxin
VVALPGAKRYLREERVSLNELNGERDPDAARVLAKKLGQTGVPVMKVGGARIAGFDKERIDGQPARRAFLNARRRGRLDAALSRQFSPVYSSP